MIETEKTTIEPKLYNGTSITTTIWDNQSTDITTISSKGIETGILYAALGCIYIRCRRVIANDIA